MKSLSIVVPCYNEEKTIRIFYDTVTPILNSLSGYDYEIIFVNDGSKDDTKKEIESLISFDPRVSLVGFSRNFGKEAGLFAGLEYSIGDAVIVIDVDLQDPPDLIPELVAQHENGYDVVYTKRKSRDNEPVIRSFFANLFYKIINEMSDVEIVNGARDYRLMDRKVVNGVLEMKEKNRFSKGLFVWVGFKSKVIEFEYKKRVAGSTKWSFFGLFSYAIDGIVSFSNVPLKIASYLGITASTCSFLFLLYVLIKNLVVQNPVSGWASTIAIIIFFGGIQLMMMGILGEYIGRIYTEIKDRPLYFIDEFKESSIRKKICKESN